MVRDEKSRRRRVQRSSALVGEDYEQIEAAELALAVRRSLMMTNTARFASHIEETRLTVLLLPVALSGARLAGAACLLRPLLKCWMDSLWKRRSWMEQCEPL